MLTIVSLGAGVQSTTMVLMAAEGLIEPMPDFAIFADTGAEPEAVYNHLAWLEEAGRLPFPIHRVSGGNLRDILLASEPKMPGQRSKSNVRPPLFVKNPNGKAGMIRRQCTTELKIVPIERHIRTLLGLRKGQRWPTTPVVEQWLGISTDEATRMKPSRRPAIMARWPLIELEMSRKSCEVWLKLEGYPIPAKSACTFCPFHSDSEWRHIRDTDPKGWADAVAVDAAVSVGLQSKNLSGELYVHKSLVPLPQVDLAPKSDKQINLFENECAGVCGV